MVVLIFNLEDKTLVIDKVILWERLLSIIKITLTEEYSYLTVDVASASTTSSNCESKSALSLLNCFCQGILS